jgi:hypothetical protein
MTAASDPAIHVEETGPQTFELTVTFEGRRFSCGSYLNRAAALQAGRLFVERKVGERSGQRKRPRKKPTP